MIDGAAGFVKDESDEKIAFGSFFIASARLFLLPNRNNYRMSKINLTDKKLKGTKTEKNLWEAVRAEATARAKYDAFADAAQKEGYVTVSEVFRKTAQNEQAHALLWMNELGVVSPDTVQNLLDAARSERKEWSDFYEQFAAEAEKEGFTEIADRMRLVAVSESAHEQAYRELAANITLGDAFDKSKPVLWKCENCGYVSLAAFAPEVCPACSSPQGFFRERKESLR